MTLVSGRGYVDGNAIECGDTYMYVDDAVPCNETGVVTSIEANITVNGGQFSVGCGWIVGSTFYWRSTVDIDLTGLGTGQKTFTSPLGAAGTFDQFAIREGDVLAFYCHATGFCRIDRTSTGATGYKWTSGNKMGDASFTIGGSDATKDLEVKLLGVEAYPHEVDGTDADIIADIDGTARTNIADVD